MTRAEVQIRPIEASDGPEVCALVLHSFDEFVVPGYREDGVAMFRKYLNPEVLRKRATTGHSQLVAHVGLDLAGMIEVREQRHVSLLFVDRRWHRRGVAWALLERALELILDENPSLDTLTVNSSPYAVTAYEHLGFGTTGPEQEENGIRFIPMARSLESETRTP